MFQISELPPLPFSIYRHPQNVKNLFNVQGAELDGYGTQHFKVSFSFGANGVFTIY